MDMNVPIIKIPYEYVSLIEFVYLSRRLESKCDMMYLDGDEKAVIIVNPRDNLIDEIPNILHWRDPTS